MGVSPLHIKDGIPGGSTVSGCREQFVTVLLFQVDGLRSSGQNLCFASRKRTRFSEPKTTVHGLGEWKSPVLAQYLVDYDSMSDKSSRICRTAPLCCESIMLRHWC
mmetsp:Transcript_40964/g.89248  ORF Transcript_40964/g.89248 Transcript_40964/m.89248 type:complete len:106 (+) Transcript_40964:290-607(+)